MRIANLENNKRKIISNIGNLAVLEYVDDASVSPANAMTEYFMSKMGVRRRQLVCRLNGKNSIIAQGCVIDGEVENCVISKGVYVGKGAKLSNCIVMQDAIIGADTNLNYVIIDKDVQIKDGRSLMGFDSYPSYIAKKSVV